MKHLLYLRYVLIHKWWVFVACAREGLWWRGLIHDWHKFLPSEWFPYTWSFYGPWKYGDRPERLVLSFELAWLRHQNRADHHWQWWMLINDEEDARLLNMSPEARLEMVCDWWGAGRAQGETKGWASTAEWYEKNRDNMHLHTETRAWVEGFISRKTS